MRKIIICYLLLSWSLVVHASPLFQGAKVMNPGKAVGQIVLLTANDVKEETEKYKDLNPLSIPVFEESPMDLSVVMGTITFDQQNLLSHVQIKAVARKTPNLDISQMDSETRESLFSQFPDGSYISMELTADGGVNITASTEEDAIAFYKEKLKQMEPVELKADLNEYSPMTMSEISWTDFDKVGSKAANYAELAKALNTDEKTYVRPSIALSFSYYQQFVEDNLEIAEMIAKVSRDPLMKKVKNSRYRKEKLSELREFIEENSVVSEALIGELTPLLDEFKTPEGLSMKMKLRSSTNAEDLPNFNGAGLYSSKSYKPVKKGKEKKEKKKKNSLRKALRAVWASTWNLRAFEERQSFNIPHSEIYMGVQINPSFNNQDVDGVVVTSNIAGREDLSGAGVYMEVQRGEEYSVANPDPNIKPEQILVLYDEANPMDISKYSIHVLQRSNVGDDNKTILESENPNSVLSEKEVVEVVAQSLKAKAHFKPLLGAEDPNFSLDLEFKVDSEFTGMRNVYFKQARPFIH